MSTSVPVYLTLFRSGELKRRVQAAYERLRACDLCGRQCHVNRYEQLGACHTGVQAVVSSVGPHLGEEDPLRGYRGSGTIFFAWCNLNCQFCQNYDISQSGHGRQVEPEELAAMMLSLQAQECHNINLVSPTHVASQILAAVLIAAEAGLRLPLVWNTGGYDDIHIAIRQLPGSLTRKTQGFIKFRLAKLRQTQHGPTPRNPLRGQPKRLLDHGLIGSWRKNDPDRRFQSVHAHTSVPFSP